jgi:hypothetical protein
MHRLCAGSGFGAVWVDFRHTAYLMYGNSYDFLLLTPLNLHGPDRLSFARANANPDQQRARYFRNRWTVSF